MVLVVERVYYELEILADLYSNSTVVACIVVLLLLTLTQIHLNCTRTWIACVAYVKVQSKNDMVQFR